MSNKLRKIAASVMAVATLTTGAMGISASAYSPTISKSFGVSATATLYADTGYAYATTSCSGKDCTVSVTYHGTTKSGYGYGYANVNNSASGSGSKANSYHAAGGYTTSIAF